MQRRLASSERAKAAARRITSDPIGRQTALAFDAPRMGTGDRVARLEMLEPHPQVTIASLRLPAGANHPSDIPGMIRPPRFAERIPLAACRRGIRARAAREPEARTSRGRPDRRPARHRTGRVQVDQDGRLAVISEPAGRGRDRPALAGAATAAPGLHGKVPLGRSCVGIAPAGACRRSHGARG
jgi:hypothetical protein